MLTSIKGLKCVINLQEKTIMQGSISFGYFLQKCSRDDLRKDVLLVYEIFFFTFYCPLNFVGMVSGYEQVINYI